MRAVYWTAFGALLIPIGVLLVVEVPSLGHFPLWLILAGAVSMALGWVYTLRDERRKDIESKLRIRREKTTIILLTYMAEQLGVDMDKLNETMKDRLNG